MRSYDMNEVCVGEWSGGFNLYRKIIFINSPLPSSSGQLKVPHEISNLSAIVKITGRTTNGSVFAPLPFISRTNQAGNIELYADRTNVNIGVSEDKSSYTTTSVELYYTKNE